MNNKYKFSLLKNIFKRKNVGFSLVEIVIVIAVIAILAAVLVPTFSSIIDKSNDIKLIQNARIKYEMYISDCEFYEEEIINNIIITDENNKCVVIINGSLQNIIFTYDEAKQYMKDNIHKYIDFIEYSEDNSIIFVINMDNVVSLKEVTNINELNVHCKIILGYKDNNGNIYTFSKNVYENEYKYIKGIDLENDDLIALITNDICTFTLTENGTGWGFKTQNGLFLDPSEPLFDVLGNLYYYLRNEESCLSSSHLWSINIENGETIISSFQNEEYQLQYNENGNYFGSFMGINNNMKIYIITEE